MLDLAQGVREQIIKETAPKVAVPKTFTMRRLRSMLLWGVGATCALAIAVLSGRGETGMDRLAQVLHGDVSGAFSGDAGKPSQQAATFNAQAETQRLGQVVRELAVNDDRIKYRLAALEQNLDDVTGSVSKQIEAADVARRVDDGPSFAATANITAALPPPPDVPAFAPTATEAAPTTTGSIAAAPGATQAEAAPVVPPLIPYGVDIGSGLTIQALRARWAVIHNSHAKLFEGMEPIVTVKEMPRSNRVELRLVVGPLQQASAAEQLCASLTSFGLYCQPAMYDGQRLAVR
jgi:hypothetical protein